MPAVAGLLMSHFVLRLSNLVCSVDVYGNSLCAVKRYFRQQNIISN